MRYLNLRPDEQGYSVRQDNSHVYAKLAGGASRLRRDVTGTPYEISCQFSLTQDEYLYFMTFYRVTDGGATVFEMDLIMDDASLTRHSCKFVPNSVRVSDVKGFRYVVRCKIEAEPLAADSDYDEGLVTTFEGFGQEGSKAYELLEQLVNVTMPANIK